MKRTLLFIMALLVSASYSFAADPNNPDLLSQGFDDFWGSKATYDDATQTINYPDAWGSAVWTFWSNGDISAYQTLIFEFEPVDFDVQPVIQYGGDGGEYKERFPGSAGKITINLTSASVEQIAIQNSEPGELTLTAAYLSKGGSGESECAVIMDFSELPDATNNNSQQGWLTSDIMEELAAAKYLVIETEGIGDNADGFGGMHLIFQGNDGVTDADGDGKVDELVGWTDRALNGDWLSYPREDGKIVSLVLDVKNVFGDKYDDFLLCTGWARILLGYYGGSSAYVGLGVKQVYLTKDFAKPEGAVDLTGGTDWGFIFDGSVACEGEGPEPLSDIVFDFEGDEIGATYPVMHAWGWPDDGSSATVVADPLEISGNSLKVVTGNYDGCVYFDVTLPEGKTVANINAVQFDAYFEEGEGDITGTIELFMAASDAPIGDGAAFSAYPVYLKTPDTSDQIQVAVAGEWFTNDITRANIKDAAYNLKGNVPDFAAINDLNQFLFGIGLSLQGGSEYYMDNITFVLGDPQSNTQTVVLERSLVYPVVGGIIVTGANEKVLVYGIDGRLVKQTLADNQFIPLEKGLYIVKVGAAAAVKVLVK